jgi:hypothetical protein
MPAEAGIQSVVEINNFKDLDSRFRGNDGVFPITTQSLEAEGFVVSSAERLGWGGAGEKPFRKQKGIFDELGGSPISRP